MQKNIPLRQRALQVIEQLRARLIDPSFSGRHRCRPADFTRQCVLTFPVLMLLLLQKSLKSLQAHLHEFLAQLAEGAHAPSLSGGALTHARAKLHASAFVELNTVAVLATVYGPAHAALVQRWRGHRLLGVDSSLMRLPTSAAVGEKFGWVQCANHHGPQERYPQGRVSVLYDVLNQVALDARLLASTVAETELAHAHLAHVSAGDVLLNDRGYTGYRWLVAVQAAGAHFVSRCSRGSFAAVQRLFARNEAGVHPGPLPSDGRGKAHHALAKTWRGLSSSRVRRVSLSHPMGEGWGEGQTAVRVAGCGGRATRRDSPPARRRPPPALRFHCQRPRCPLNCRGAA